MEKTSHSLRNTIVGTVIGGLILAGLLRLIPSFLKWLLNSFKLIWEFLFLKVELSNWLFILLLGIVSYSLFRVVKKLLSYKEQEMKKPFLSNEEKYVLALLIKVDGRSLTCSEIAAGIKCAHIHTKHALEQLEEKDLIRSYSGSYGSVDVYGLTRLGRELVIETGFDKTILGKQKKPQ